MRGWMLLILAVPVLYLFGLPLITLFLKRIPANPEFEPADEYVGLLGLARDCFEDVSKELGEVGFETTGTLFVPEPFRTEKSIARVFANRSQQDVAIAVAMFSSREDKWKLETQDVGFGTVFEDSTIVSLSNRPAGGLVLSPAHEVSVRAPWITEPRRLYDAHRSVCRLVAGGTERAWPLDSKYGGDVTAYFADIWTRELDEARKRGLLRLVNANPVADCSVQHSAGLYRATVKGAYIMTWAGLWPFKQINAAVHLRRSRWLLEQAGINWDE